MGKIELSGTIVVLALLAVASLSVVLADPINPDTLTAGAPSRQGEGSAQSSVAIAGNVTPLTFQTDTVTKYWQGYYGNISGQIVLADSSGNNLYQWELADPNGEIYASRYQSINWTNVDCMLNATVVREDANLSTDPVLTTDSINRTFNKTLHKEFSVGSNLFNANTCKSTYVNNTGNTDIFQEVLLADHVNLTNNVPTGTAQLLNRTLYVALLNRSQTGFAQAPNDFQLIVPENGNGSEEWPNGNPSTFYFYVEIS